MISRRNAIAGASAAVGVGMATSASALLASDVKSADDMARARAVKATKDILASHKLPEGVFVFPDVRTGSVMTICGELGFAFTPSIIAGDLHMRQFQPALDGLVRLAKEVSDNRYDPEFRKHLGLPA